MKVEAMEFKRCCCCFPLRYGLLVWGYLRLIISTVMIIAVASNVVMGLLYAVRGKALLSSRYATSLIIFAVLLFVMLIDISLNITFLVGAHKKNPRLLRVYNYYSIGMLVLYILAVVVLFGIEISILARSNYVGPAEFFYMLRIFLASALVNVAVQLYQILMTRSEILKLENNCQFRFVNNANGECTLSQQPEDGTVTDQPLNMKHNENTENDINENDEDSKKKNGNYARLNE